MRTEQAGRTVFDDDDDCAGWDMCFAPARCDKCCPNHFGHYLWFPGKNTFSSPAEQIQMEMLID